MDVTPQMLQTAQWSSTPWNNGSEAPRDIEPAVNVEKGTELEVREEAQLLGVAPERLDFTTMRDEQLMAEVIKADTRALEVLYDRHVKGCFGLSMKIVRDPLVAEEVVQDVFMKLWSHPERFAPDRGKFSGWLLTVVHNRSVDKLRRARSGTKQSNIPIDQENEAGTSLADILSDAGPTPHDQAWAGEKGRIVRNILGQLPETQRQAIVLAYFEGLTQKEIAEKLQEPLGTIKTRTRSALQHLRRLLDRQGLLAELH